MDKNLFGFLKSRAIFTHGGAKTYHEAVTHREEQSENNNRARKGTKKARYKR